MRDYMKEFEETLNKITESVLDDEDVKEGNYETSDANKKITALGRILMDQAVTTKDDALANTMARVGDALTAYGTSYGARSLEELVKKTGVAPKVIQKLLGFAEKIQQTTTAVKTDHSDGGLDDEGNDEFAQAGSDEIDAMSADRAATRAMRR
jgi:hypothetical protein